MAESEGWVEVSDRDEGGAVIWGRRQQYAGHDGRQALYISAKVRPRWYWFLMRWRLFAKIVWRKSDEGRLSIQTAREVSLIVHPL